MVLLLPPIDLDKYSNRNRLPCVSRFLIYTLTYQVSIRNIHHRAGTGLSKLVLLSIRRTIVGTIMVTAAVAKDCGWSKEEQKYAQVKSQYLALVYLYFQGISLLGCSLPCARFLNKTYTLLPTRAARRCRTVLDVRRFLHISRLPSSLLDRHESYRPAGLTAMATASSVVCFLYAVTTRKSHHERRKSEGTPGSVFAMNISTYTARADPHVQAKLSIPRSFLLCSL